jgi:opacity protein-like surface antigen
VKRLVFLVVVLVAAISAASAMAAPAPKTIVDTNRADWMGNWVSIEVQDGGESGINADKLRGAFSNQTEALLDVEQHRIPSTGNESPEYSVSSGNLQVH